jgi:hypothetical protein
MSDLLFDDDDDLEAPDPAMAWQHKLAVGAPCEADDLQRLEMQYRLHGSPPVLFDDGEGIWNQAEFARAMGRDDVTLEEAEAWLDQQAKPGGAFDRAGL